MSVQLILYPQNNDGTYAFNSAPRLNEYVNDPNIISGVTNTAILSYMNNDWGYQISNANSPANSWIGYYTSVNTSVWNATTQPLYTNPPGTVTLYATAGSAPLSLSGLYQTIQGLTAGADYRVVVNHESHSGNGFFLFGTPTVNTSIGHIGGGQWGSQVAIGNVAANFTHFYFTANSPTMELFVSYIHSATSNFDVYSISVTEDPRTNMPQNITDLTDGQVICDLYQDQDIPLTLSVDEFKNITEKTQSYSKSFDLPNTKRNSRIFTHIFEITRVITSVFDFNPYAKTRAVLKQNGVSILDGFLRLIDITEKKGEISYNVNLYTDSIALVDTLKGRNFLDLDFSELDHAYTRTNIMNSWYDTVGIELNNTITSDSFAYNAALPSPNDHTTVLKYPLVNWIGDIIKGGSNSPYGTSSNHDMPEMQNLTDFFRPFIQIKYLINKIFKASGFTFTSSFFDTDDFKRLFMDFNGLYNGAQPIRFRLGYDTFTQLLTTSFTNAPYGAPAPTTWGNFIVPSTLAQYYDYSTNQFDFTTDNTVVNIKGWCGVKSTGVSPGGSPYHLVDFRVHHFNTSTGATINTYSVQQQQINNNHSYNFMYDTNSIFVNNGESLSIQAKAPLSSSGASGTYKFDYGLYTATLSGFITDTNTISSNLLNSNRGELGQWDFLKGIFTMFNLVTLSDPNNPGNIIIEPYNDIFGESPTVVTPKTLDWTYKVDTEETKIEPIDLSKIVKLQYEEDTSDYPANVYKLATQSANYLGLYGSKKINTNGMLGLTGGMTSLLTGEEEVVASPFAATVIKPLDDGQLQYFITPAIYSATNDDATEFESYGNLPRILYDNGIVDLTPVGLTYFVPNQNGVTGANLTAYLQFTHWSNTAADRTAQAGIGTPDNDNRDYNFGEAATIEINSNCTNNLYNMHYSQYFSELYNPNTRILKVKANLNAADINTFRFYDRVFIKNREFRVNKIQYNPNALSIVELILLP